MFVKLWKENVVALIDRNAKKNCYVIDVKNIIWYSHTTTSNWHSTQHSNICIHNEKIEQSDWLTRCEKNKLVFLWHFLNLEIWKSYYMQSFFLVLVLIFSKNFIIFCFDAVDCMEKFHQQFIVSAMSFKWFQQMNVLPIN